jgi:hypothetical protein
MTMNYKPFGVTALLVGAAQGAIKSAKDAKENITTSRYYHAAARKEQQVVNRVRDYFRKEVSDANLCEEQRVEMMKDSGTWVPLEKREIGG